MKIELAGREFRTKQEAAEEISKIIHESPIGVPLSEHQDLLLELLRGHPNAEAKIGVGIEHFRVTTNKYKSRCLEAVRVDGSTTDFSYRKCLREPTGWEEFIHALRREVEFDVICARDAIFGESPVIKCPLSGKFVTVEEVDVDHEPPHTFEVLAQQFAVQENIDRKNPPITPSVDGVIGRFLSNKELRARWQAFHLANAKLRVISKEAHREIGKA